MKNLVIVIMALCGVVFNADAQWQQTTAPQSNPVNCLSVANGAICAGTAGGGIITSIDSGASWVTKNTGLSNLNINALCADTSGTMYAGSNSLLLFTSADTGNNWTAGNVGGTGTSISSVVTYGTNILLGEVGDGVFKSVNSGASWSEVGLCCASVLSLCSAQNGYVFAGTGSTVYRSGGAFTSWSPVNNGLPGSAVKAIAETGSMVFAGTNGSGVYVTANNGSNWTQANNGLSDLLIISLAANDTKIFAGTDAGGVFVSVDSGNNWIQVNDNLTYLNIPSLAIHGSYLYAGTVNGGIWKRSLSEFSAVAEPQPVRGFCVYPNPAAGQLTVRLETPAGGQAVLNIYDILGTLIHSELLVNVQNDVSVGNLKHGVYLVEVKTGDRSEITKMLIQR